MQASPQKNSRMKRQRLGSLKCAQNGREIVALQSQQRTPLFKGTYRFETTNTSDHVAHKQHIEYSVSNSKHKGPPNISHPASCKENTAWRWEELLPQGDGQGEISE